MHQHIVADAFRSKKSSSVLLFMNSKYHKSDAFQVTLQLLMVIARETYTRKQAVYTHKWTHTHTHTHTEREKFQTRKKNYNTHKILHFLFPWQFHMINSTNFQFIFKNTDC